MQKFPFETGKRIILTQRLNLLKLGKKAVYFQNTSNNKAICEKKNHNSIQQCFTVSEQVTKEPRISLL